MPSISADLSLVELDETSEAVLQEFFEQNPLYFETVCGEPATPGEAHEEITGTPPSGWNYSRKWLIGRLDTHGMLTAFASVVADLLADGVWHIGLFIVATDRHGTGYAGEFYQAVESWAKSSGAVWLRLGVVQGYSRAEHFWNRQGYTRLRTRDGIEIGRKSHRVVVLVKPLASLPLTEYLELVKRDHPDSTL